MHQESINITQYWQSFQEGLEEGAVFFFEKYYSLLCYFANRFVRDKEAAADIVSEALIKVWEKRNTIETPLAFKNYCYTTVRHACLRRLEDQQRLQPDAATTRRTIYEETALLNIIRSKLQRSCIFSIQRLPKAAKYLPNCM